MTQECAMALDVGYSRPESPLPDEAVGEVNWGAAFA